MRFPITNFHIYRNRELSIYGQDCSNDRITSIDRSVHICIRSSCSIIRSTFSIRSTFTNSRRVGSSKYRIHCKNRSHRRITSIYRSIKISISSRSSVFRSLFKVRVTITYGNIGNGIILRMND